MDEYQMYVWIDAPIPSPAAELNSQMIEPLRTFCWLPPTPVLLPQEVPEETDRQEEKVEKFVNDEKANMHKGVKNKGKGKTTGKGNVIAQRKRLLKKPVLEDEEHYARSQKHLQSREFNARRLQHLQLPQRHRGWNWQHQQWEVHNHSHYSQDCPRHEQQLPAPVCPQVLQ